MLYLFATNSLLNENLLLRRDLYELNLAKRFSPMGIMYPIAVNYAYHVNSAKNTNKNILKDYEKFSFHKIMGYIFKNQVNITQIVNLIIGKIVNSVFQSIKSIFKIIIFISLIFIIGCIVIIGIICIFLLLRAFGMNINAEILTILLFSGLGIFGVVLYFIVFSWSIFDLDESIKSDSNKMFLDKMQNEIVQDMLNEIDLRPFGGDKNVINQYRDAITHVIHNFCNYFLNEILLNSSTLTSVILSIISFDFKSLASPLPALSKLILFAIKTFLMFLKTMEFDNKQQKDSNDLDNLYKLIEEIFHLVITIKYLVQIINAIFIVIVILPFFFMTIDGINPIDFVVGTASKFDIGQLSGIYDEQIKLCLNFIFKYNKDQSKWRNLQFLTSFGMFIITFAGIIHIILNLSILNTISNIQIPGILEAMLNFIDILKTYEVPYKIQFTLKAITSIMITIQILAGCIILISNLLRIYEFQEIVQKTLENMLKINGLLFRILPTKALSIGTEGGILLRDTSFAYTPEGSIVRHVGSLYLKDGLIFICGPSGSGKTTTIKGITGDVFQTNPAGEMFVTDGFNLQSLDTMNLTDRSQLLATVKQNTTIDSDNKTIKEYLCRDRKYTDNELIFILQALGLATDKKSALEFLNRNLGLSAGVLSGGQRVRLDLVDKILLRPCSCFLDESLDNLDPHTTQKVLQFLIGGIFNRMNNQNLDFNSIENSRTSYMIITHKPIIMFNMIYKSYGVDILKYVRIMIIQDGVSIMYNLYDCIMSNTLVEVLEQILGPQSQDILNLDIFHINKGSK